MPENNFVLIQKLQSQKSAFLPSKAQFQSVNQEMLKLKLFSDFFFHENDFLPSYYEIDHIME